MEAKRGSSVSRHAGTHTSKIPLARLMPNSSRVHISMGLVPSFRNKTSPTIMYLAVHSLVPRDYYQVVLESCKQKKSKTASWSQYTPLMQGKDRPTALALLSAFEVFSLV